MNVKSLADHWVISLITVEKPVIPPKGKVVWEFEKIDSYNHDPDTDCDSSIFSGCAPEWIFDFFHDERIDLLLILLFIQNMHFDSTI